jgi:hypothetical protein
MDTLCMSSATPREQCRKRAQPLLNRTSLSKTDSYDGEDHHEVLDMRVSYVAGEPQGRRPRTPHSRELLHRGGGSTIRPILRDGQQTNREPGHGEAMNSLARTSSPARRILLVDHRRPHSRNAGVRVTSCRVAAGRCSQRRQSSAHGRLVSSEVTLTARFLQESPEIPPHPTHQ